MKNFGKKILLALLPALLFLVAFSPSIASAHSSGITSTKPLQGKSSIQPKDIFVCNVGGSVSKAGTLLLGRGSIECTTPTFYQNISIGAYAQYCNLILGFFCNWQTKGTIAYESYLAPSFNVTYKAPASGGYSTYRVAAGQKWRVEVYGCAQDADESGKYCQTVDTNAVQF